MLRRTATLIAITQQLPRGPLANLSDILTALRGYVYRDDNSALTQANVQTGRSKIYPKNLNFYSFHPSPYKLTLS